MNIIIFQVIVNCVVLFLTVVSVLIPIYLKNLVGEEKQIKILAFMSYFTAGVFLGAGIIHMLPESAEQWEEALPDNRMVIYLLCCLGYAFVWSLDKFPISTNKNEAVAIAVKSKENKESANLCYVKIEPVISYQKIEKKNVPEAISIDNTSNKIKNEELEHSNVEINEIHECKEIFTHSHSHDSKHADNKQMHDHQHSMHHHHIVISAGDWLPIVLAFVFSFHSFLAGMTLGIQGQIDRSAISILFAILGHKSVEALSISSILTREKIPFKKTISVLSIYSVMTPLGAIVGIILQFSIADSFAGLILFSIIQSFCVGSFIYLSQHELSDHSCSHVVPNWSRITLFIIGIVIMALIGLVL